MTGQLDICARLTCSRCGETGTGFWRRDALRGQGRELLGLTRGFLRKPGDRRADPSILCAACRAPAREMPFLCEGTET